MPSVCGDCITIAHELREAYAEVWESDNGRLRAAWMATCKMIGGDERDVERAEEIVPQLHASDISRLQPSRAGRAVLAAIAHRALTGHNVSIGIGS
jgi:hypothetical protein